MSHLFYIRQDKMMITFILFVIRESCAKLIIFLILYQHCKTIQASKIKLNFNKF